MPQSFVLFFYGLIFLLAILTLGFLSINPWEAMFIAGLLVLLEVSLSFDNAVINARVLKHMSPVWQRRFLTWGILSAVFLVRLVLPFLLVYFGSNLSLSQVMDYALRHPDLYHQALLQAFPYIAAFGSGFLFMVWLAFMHEQKSQLWLGFIERSQFWQSKWVLILIIVLIGSILGLLAQRFTLTFVFFVAAAIQWLLHATSHRLSQNLATAGKLGLAGFIYLEFLDTSFSLDGVVGAFAITSDIATIMVGLGCGALVMRAFTVYCVQHHVNQRFRYLEHGAHYAIVWLAAMLLLKLYIHVPEWLTGLGSLFIIALSIASSLRHE